MMSKEEKEVLEDLENNIPYDYCRGCDSEDGLYHEYINEDSWQYKIKMLLEKKDKEIKTLKNNWNELEDWLETTISIHKQKGSEMLTIICSDILNEIKKLKGSDKK